MSAQPGQPKQRRAKDGTLYAQVGPDQWQMVTRQAKDGTVYKSVGEDQWSPIKTEPIEQPDYEGRQKATMAGVEGFAESATLGTLPYLQAAGSEATDFVAENLMGAPENQESYQDKVQRYKERGDQLEKENPKSYMAGNLAGFLVPGAGSAKIVKAGAKALKAPKFIQGTSQLARAAKKAKEVGRAAELAGNAAKAEKAFKLASRLNKAKLAGQAVKLGAEGTILGAAYTPESGFTDVKARVKGGVIGGATGAVMPYGLAGAGKVAKGSLSLPRRVLSTVMGVEDDVIQRYLANPDRVRNAPTLSQLQEEIAGVANSLRNAADDAKIDADDARAVFDDLARGVKESRVKGKEQALDLLRQQKSLLNESFKFAKENLKKKAAPSRIAGQVDDALDSLKKKVIKGSDESFDILATKPASESPVSDAYRYALNTIQDLSERSSADAKAGAEKIRYYAQEIFRKSKNPNGKLEMKPGKIKELIQDIDSDINMWKNEKGGFDDKFTRAMKGLRNQLDDTLKSNFPDYKAKMADVADNASTLSQASKQFGGKNQLSRLSNIANPNSKKDLELLQKLTDKYDGNVTKAINEMVKSQRKLKSPVLMDELKRSLPEAKDLRSAEMAAASAKRLAKPRAVRKAIENSSAKYKMLSAKEKAKQARDLAAKFRGFQDAGVESKIGQVIRGKKYATDQLRALSKMSNKDFVESVKAFGDADAFTKKFFSGSRNTLMGSLMGLLAQSATGAGAGFAFGGPVGAAIGAVMGGMIDVYGPRTTKVILDQVIRARSFTPNVIKKMNVPPRVKKELMEAFHGAVLGGRAQSMAESSKNLVATKRDDRPKTMAQMARGR